MASFGHVAVGMLAGRWHGGPRDGVSRRQRWGTLAFFAALGMVPDADVFGVALGACDVGAAGHRGASHSLAVALGIGMVCAALARRLGWPPLRTAIAGTLAVASHGLLDACGEGGRELPLLWPLSDARFSSPWRFLPDAPRGLEVFSAHGLAIIGIEFLLFFPLTVLALWPSARAAPAAPSAPAAAPRLVVIDGGRAVAEPPVAASAPGGDREPPVRSSG